ncbi:hypothetical protein SAMD00019534_074280 [Acytostelium subglobosum LB1]|uniref:hypothetical protein n=1 Tax=Acytostelium subglobosum LB1 TaxID=1410327 RepID=UPI0006448DB0|nr:hypothetical protein SAMD00019534_074280 [Acytostelium subglobosum LB1]GAM24253.1 hypothetical protein SAMD00019534_074280 [Acytostelium subglobosum LB1]|eukprot:XP_012752579.1 hypothetical protein SAMD00019534_074280 [Acytostelium subglobosum LB1]
MKLFVIISFLTLLVATLVAGYQWDNLRVGGGGYVTGIAIHPTTQDRMYVRTDVGGAYRWDSVASKWIQLLDWVGPSQANLIGVDGMALDKNYPDRLYLALGKNLGDGGLYRSEDKGETWTRLLTAQFNGNGRDQRWGGEPIAVDPLDSNIIYCGTRVQGLYRSVDNGATWTNLASVPVGHTGTDPTGIRIVEFDPSTVVSGHSGKIYVGIAGTGIYRSTDGGATFSALSGAPTSPRRMQVVNGILFVTHSTGVSKWNGSAWTNITPSASAGKDFCGLAVEAANPLKLLVSERYSSFNNVMYRSVDGGSTWTKIGATGAVVSNKFREAQWWPTNWWEAATADLVLNPFAPGQFLYTDWFGVWKTNTIWGSTMNFTTQVRGIEETVVLTLTAPPSGALLFSGMADVGGFRHQSLTDWPVYKNPKAETFSIDFVETSPAFVAALDATDWDGTNSRLITSTDSGSTWTAAALPSGTTLGRLAYSATNNNRIVYVAGGGSVYYSSNRGVSWTQATGAPSGAVGLTDIWNRDNALASDRVDGAKFYLFSQGIIYASTDSGATWAAKTTTAIPKKAGYLNVVTVPGKANELWVGLDGNGLYRSTNGGVSFTKISFFQTCSGINFGKADPANPTVPATFAYGKVGGVYGMYRSSDSGATWTQINDATHQFPCGVKSLSGDRNTFGRVYVATGGCGVLYGQP